MNWGGGGVGEGSRNSLRLTVNRMVAGSNPARGAKNPNKLKANFLGAHITWPPNYFGGAPGARICLSTPSPASLERIVGFGPIPKAGRNPYTAERSGSLSHPTVEAYSRGPYLELFVRGSRRRQ